MCHISISPIQRHWLLTETLFATVARMLGQAITIAAYIAIFQSTRPIDTATWAKNWALHTAASLVDNPFFILWIAMALLFLVLILVPSMLCFTTAWASGMLITRLLTYRFAWSPRVTTIWIFVWLSTATLIWSSSILLSDQPSLWLELIGLRSIMLNSAASLLMARLSIVLGDMPVSGQP